MLAANTAYADFPRLASILARDRYLPRQLMNQGDRLAFSNGIVGLSIFAALLLVIFGGDTHALIPLYMIGVFVSFTLSQAGMVMHWRRLHGPGWKTSAAINGFGAIVTGIVLVVVAVTKAHEGAWIILLLIPIHVAFFRATRRHYDQVQAQLSLEGWTPRDPKRNVVLVPISGMHRAVVQALDYARTLSADVRAVYVGVDPEATKRLQEQWPEQGRGVELVVLPSPYRSLMEPLLEYVETLLQAEPKTYVTVALPEFVPARWWHHLFHNQSALLIKSCAALQAEYRRDERAVPSETLTIRPMSADLLLKCPVCAGPLTVGEKSATCERRHAFDVARQGYLNLLLPNQRHSPDPGDSPEMMRSRRAFLQAGFYDQMAQATSATVAEILAGRSSAAVADIGCGEGFFLSKLKASFDAEAATKAYRYVGVDISRTGVRMATTYDRKIAWIVASLHHSPFVDGSLDVVISMFSPIASSDVRRIVRPDGALVTVTPGPDHLDALRAVIYPSVVPHAETPALMAGDTGFDLVRATRVRYPIALTSAADIMNLLAMTPYYWNISLETKARVEALPSLELTVDVQVTVFRPSPMAAVRPATTAADVT